MTDLGFDVEALRKEFAETEARKEQAIQRAHNLLADYVATAKQLGVEPRVVDRTSMAAQATGIALAKWPNSPDGHIRYYPLVTASRFELWLAAESQGLSVTPENDFFLEGDRIQITEAAVWLATIAGHDQDIVTETLKNALRGKPASV